MSLTMSPTTPACVVALPTLVIAGNPALGRRAVDVLEQLAIMDVDVARDYVEGHRKASERDYSVIILAGQPARSFGFQRFCGGVSGVPDETPAIVQIQARQDDRLPCSGLPRFCVGADFATDDLRRAIWAAGERSGRACKSARLCGRTACPLEPRQSAPH